MTIRAKDAFTADAWSQGDVHPRARRRRSKLIKREKLDDFEVVWVDDQNEVVVTDRIKPAILMQRKPTAGI